MGFTFNFHSVVKRKRRRTEVEILNGKVIKAVGWSKQSNEDKDNRVLGQKYAIRRAIRNLPTDERILIWKDFGKHSKRAKELNIAATTRKLKTA